MNDYGKALVDYYDLFAAGVKGDVEFYVQESVESGGPVLELGCGTGRTLIPIAKAGVDIVGLDRSEDMLAVINRKVAALSEDVRGRIEILEGDMRDFSLGRKFKLITSPYRAFLHNLTVEDQKKALSCVRGHLDVGGRFILNIFDPRLDFIAPRTQGGGAVMKRMQQFTVPETGNRMIIWAAGTHDPERQIIEETWMFDEIDHTDTVIKRTYSPLTLRWIYRYEMQHLLESSGYRIDALYGDFDRGPFRYGGEQIWVASVRER